jgi:putative transposase
MTSWPHAPYHSFSQQGTYIITAATYHKALLFKKSNELDLLQNLLFELAEHYKWKLESWAIFANHYHFIARSPEDSKNLEKFIKHFHAASARAINQTQGAKGRQVWYQYWDTRLTFQNSYYSRLKYVHNNPVKHGLVKCAKDYNWCSAYWFEANADPVFYKTVESYKIDSVNIIDDF